LNMMARALALAATLSALGGVGIASAQDGGTYNWSGFYAGVQAGNVAGDSDVSAAITGESRGCVIGFCSSYTPYSLPDPAATASSRLRGMAGGVYTGYNWQWNQLIIGGEFDINASDADTAPASLVSIFNGGIQIGSFSTSLDWYGSARGRVGLDLAGGLMVYGTAGLAFGSVENSIGYNVGTFSEAFSDRETRTGWTAGGGMEMQLFKSPRWRLKTEYLYTDLGGSDFFNQSLPNLDARIFGTGIQSRNNEASASADLKFHTVRVGISYAF
jgi:outer membrane immunogenic protein